MSVWRASVADSPPMCSSDVSCWARRTATCAFSVSTSTLPFLRLRLSSLERLRLAVEALGSVQQEAFLALEVGSPLAGLVLGGALGLEDLVLALEDDLLLLGAGIGHQPFGVRLGGADLGRGQDAAGQVAEDRAHDGRQSPAWRARPWCQASAPPSQELRGKRQAHSRARG